MGLWIDAWGASVYPVESNPLSLAYQIELGKRRVPDQSIKTANELLNVITEAESVKLQAWPFTGNAAKLIHRLSRISYLQLDIDKETTAADFQALTAVGRIDSINLQGNAPDEAMMDALSNAQGVQELGIESTERVPDEGLAHLSRLNTLTKLELLFQGCKDDSLEHVIKIRSLRELTLPTSISSEAIKNFRAARPDVKVMTQELPQVSK
ncbi:MAG TPA: hypothetical protein VG056_00420 [Pirellulales bacterium]|jgi:hypothetical protein|nr:hypothetical protein [Pirellulales bacterium]